MVKRELGHWKGYCKKPCEMCGSRRVGYYDSKLHVCDDCGWCVQKMVYVRGVGDSM